MTTIASGENWPHPSTQPADVFVAPEMPSASAPETTSTSRRGLLRAIRARRARAHAAETSPYEQRAEAVFKAAPSSVLALTDLSDIVAVQETTGANVTPDIFDTTVVYPLIDRLGLQEAEVRTLLSRTGGDVRLIPGALLLPLACTATLHDYYNAEHGLTAWAPSPLQDM